MGGTIRCPLVKMERYFKMELALTQTGNNPINFKMVLSEQQSVELSIILTDILKRGLKSAQQSIEPVEPVVAEPIIIQSCSTKGSQTKTKPINFKFKGISYSVTRWSETMERFCTMIYLDKPQEFIRILRLKGKRRQYFNRDGFRMRDPVPIGDSGIYLETHLGANNCKSVMDAVSRLFGYGDSADVESRGIEV